MRPKADVRGQILARSSSIIEDKDREQKAESRRKRRLEAEGRIFEQRTEVFEWGMRKAE
jgi:hypothetical protein